MDKKFRKTLVKYSVAVAVGGAMAAGVLFLQGYSVQAEAAVKYKILCDAFTVPAVVFVMLSALLFLGDGGLFDGIGYVAGRLIGSLIPFARRTDETYAEYKARKRSGGKLKGYAFLFFVGLAFFAVGIVFLVLFYRIY